MASAKIELAIGTLTFSGEAEESWLSAQLDKVLAAAPTLTQVTITPKAAAAAPPPGGEVNGQGASGTTATLAKHIKDKGGETKQVRRFLATADWLRLKGQTGLTTALVAKALSDNHQSRLGNPADCLGQLVGRGFCVKEGTTFYISPEGLKELGYDA